MLKGTDKSDVTSRQKCSLAATKVKTASTDDKTASMDNKTVPTDDKTTAMSGSLPLPYDGRGERRMLTRDMTLRDSNGAAKRLA